MNRHIIPFSATLFALVMGATSASQPVKALQAEPVLAAESCVVYKPDGQGGYRLANTCDYNVDIAFCTQPSNDPGLCLRTQNYTRETLKAKSEGVQYPQRLVQCQRRKCCFVLCSEKNQGKSCLFSL